MKTRLYFQFPVATLVVAMALLWTATTHAAPPEKPAADARAAETNAVPQSVYVSPSTPDEGHNPFFPKSSCVRIIITTPTGPARPAVQIVYIAFSGTPDHRLATMTINGNGRTFAEDETGEVESHGTRIKVHCLKITEENVEVEVSGESGPRTIPFRSGK